MDWRDTPATVALVALTTIVSAVLLLFGGDQAVVAGGFIPAHVSRVVTPEQLGPVPVFLTPLTATLLHGGWLHLLFNMVMLGFCGRETERALGWANVLLLYLLGAYAAATGQWLQDSSSLAPMIGASGAISALVASYSLLYGRHRARALGPVPAWIVQAVWLGAAWTGINLMLGFTNAMGQPIAIGAHIGGFVVGLLLARPLLQWRYRRA
ncbi:MAG: rhomboid family intramembrane serine protease [Sphingomonas sp.]|uniref:rhomboid family intramembrane serine protease n=1 Tax=Sphingomonas sp. TaxID=28214 RepID=UPI001AC12B06|nr:rhomboid family intramembrane serine protease [Sphingomonas sp.]MBN8807252.1 rhomboid family intramembrane serine protease [Sphingomonas sp.]